MELYRHAKNLALTLGQYVMYQLRELETPPPQPASFTYHESREYRRAEFETGNGEHTPKLGGLHTNLESEEV